MAQNDSVFRQKAIDNMSSPDELTDYLKVTNPGVWVILVAVVVLLAGIIAWACVGTLPTRADAKVIVRDGTAAILVDEPYVAAEGMTVTVGDNDCSVTPTVTDEYGEIVISEGQGGISGGQKQRLMIARAIAPKPKLLIFDEATSALDNKTQQQVTEALDRMGCTRIVVGHRLSTIRHCDRILVLDGGHIAEDGTYDELIAQDGLFAELVRRQRIDV